MADQEAERRRAVLRYAPALLPVAAAALAGCRPTFRFESHPGATQQGHSTFQLLQAVDVAAIVSVLFVWGLILYCVLRFRRRSAYPLPPQVRYNVPWEVAYFVIPAAILFALFGYTVVTENKVDAVTPHPALEIHITAFQWGWQVDYPGGARVVSVPDHITTADLPLDQTTRVTLTTRDVVHGLTVPAFDFSRYAQSGIANVFDFTPTRTGTFLGECTQFCGLHHDLMHIWFRVDTPTAFRAWLARREAGKP